MSHFFFSRTVRKLEDISCIIPTFKINMDQHESDLKVIESKVEDVSSDLQVESVAKDEQTCSVWQVVRDNPKVVFWCFFFAFSSVGW